jgi:hypothetical protein
MARPPLNTMNLLIFMVALQTERYAAVGSGTGRFDTVTSRVTLWRNLVNAVPSGQWSAPLSHLSGSPGSVAGHSSITLGEGNSAEGK